jgi:ABC-2 type transport system ATP-binding protein
MVGVTQTAASSSQVAPEDAPKPLAIEIRGVSRRFEGRQALKRVSLAVAPGEIHALLGPNGAGKTTLLRILVGLVEPDEGEIRLLGRTTGGVPPRGMRRLFGLIPSGDRSFYLRISGPENLVFFGRLNGIPRSDALRRAHRCLNEVGLEEVGKLKVGSYSHGMQKRLAVARAILGDPPILLVDEATHDLDPMGTRRVQDLVAQRAAHGVAVIWTTQRVDEIRGFADRVTVLNEGRVGFSGSVTQLMATAMTRAYVIQLGSYDSTLCILPTAQAAVEAMGTLRAIDGEEGNHYLLSLREDVVLGEAFGALMQAGLCILACREGRSEIEEALVRLTKDQQ